MAGTITQETKPIKDNNKGVVIGERIKLSCTADDSDGSFPSETVVINGFLQRIVTDPGSTAPQANWDFVINDEHGIDVAEGGGADRHTSNTEETFPVPSGATMPRLCKGDHSVVISNNNVNSALIDIYLYIYYGA